ncbi:MAG TPA: ribosome maturation factor RimM [Rhizomicrobium sp.]|jgi:16S rRNA processing protein RimM|nr:ribosome maturation factor RimM [Rhizomicrobium sp.]
MAADILLGVITAAQGLKGEVRVKTFTESPEKLAQYGVLHTAEGRNLEIAALRADKSDGAVVRFTGIEDRAAAERLVNAKLLVDRSALPATAPEEFYHADLIGLRAQDSEGRVIGEIRGIHNFGAGDVLELERPDGGTLLLPFTRDFVPKIDLGNKCVIVSEPEDVEAREQRGVE